MPDVYLLLGSNLGDREEYLGKAMRHISEEIAPVSRFSSLYETASWGKTDQPAFLNQAIFFQTHRTAGEILRISQGIEKRLGRHRDEKWGSRTIDIDILFYGTLVIDEPDLKIPHPLFQERRFAIEPMLELSRTFIHPGLNKSIEVLASELTDSLAVKRI